MRTEYVYAKGKNPTGIFIYKKKEDLLVFVKDKQLQKEINELDEELQNGDIDFVDYKREMNELLDFFYVKEYK